MGGASLYSFIIYSFCQWRAAGKVHIMGPMQWRMTGCSTPFFQECPKHAYGVATVRLECQDLHRPCFRKSHTLWWKWWRLCIFLWWHLNQNRIMSWMWQRSQHSNRCHGNSNGNGQRNCLPKCEVNFLLIEQTKKWAGAKRSKAKRGSKVKAHWYRYGQIFWSTSQYEWVVCYKR